MADSGEHLRRGGRVLGMGGKSSYDSDLRDGALRDALTKAMVNMTKGLGKRKWNGRVAQVEGRSLYINAGEKSGLQVGTKLDVYRTGKAIIGNNPPRLPSTTAVRATIRRRPNSSTGCVAASHLTVSCARKSSAGGVDSSAMEAPRKP
jgi:hypothetical protein